jgi:hypothetical protein
MLNIQRPTASYRTYIFDLNANEESQGEFSRQNPDLRSNGDLIRIVIYSGNTCPGM